MGGRGGGSPAQRGRAAAPEAEGGIPELKSRIVTAVRNMLTNTDVVGLETLRQALNPRWSRAEVDQALVQLSRERKLTFTPQSNQKVLTDRRRAASLRLGGEDKHLVTWGGNPSST